MFFLYRGCRGLKVIGTVGFHNAKDDWRQSTGIGSQTWGSSHEGSESIKQLGGDAQSYGDDSNGDKRRKITWDKSQRLTNVASLGGLKHPLCLEDRKELVIGTFNNAIVDLADGRPKLCRLALGSWSRSSSLL